MSLAYFSDPGGHVAARGCAASRTGTEPRAPETAGARCPRSRLDVTPPTSRGTTAKAPALEDVRAFYEGHGFEPVWFDGRRPRPQAQASCRAIQEAEGGGLKTTTYAVPTPRACKPRLLEPAQEGLRNGAGPGPRAPALYAFVK